VYTEFVKNLTISLPEAVLESLREQARAERKSLNAWVRELLSREVQQDSKWAEELNRLSDEIAVHAPTWTWNREDTYAERIR
jgi:hypothetical protein